MSQITVFLEAKTPVESMMKQELMNTFSGREFQFNNSFSHKGKIIVAFKCELSLFKRIEPLIEKRIKSLTVKKETK